MKNVLTLYLLIVCSLTITAQQYDLKLNLKKGQHYTQSLTMNLSMAESISDQEVNISTSIQFEIKESVKSITKNGDFVLESEYSHIIVKVDAMGQKMSYDSNVKDTSGNEAMKTYTDAFGKILDKKFTVTLSPKGKVIEIKGLKEILASMQKGNIDAAARRLLEGTLDESKMTSNFESAYHIFPDNPVNIGDKWSQKSAFETIFPMDITTTYTLKEVKDGIAQIAATADLSVKSDSIEANGTQMKINLTGSCIGMFTMNINTGISTTSTLSMPMKGTMEIMGMEVPVSMNNDMLTTTTAVN